MNAAAETLRPAWQPATQLDLELAPDPAGITRVTRRRVRYPYNLLKPFWFGDQPAGMATLPIQSASGGLFAGEHLAQNLVARPHACAHLTTQAATIVHGADSGDPSQQEIAIAVESGAWFEYVPEPLVLFPDARLQQRVHATVADDAVFIYGDGFIAHTPPADEGCFDWFENSFEARNAEEALLCVDRMRIGGAAFTQSLAAGETPRAACGAVFVIAAHRAEQHQTLVDSWNAYLAGDLSENDVYAAASPLPHERGAWCRIVAADGRGLRDALEFAWRTAREVLCGAPPPRRRK